MSRGLGIVMLLLLASCSAAEPASSTRREIATSTTATPPTTSSVATGEGCADVVAATVEPAGSDFTISATVSSADTGWDKYADLWEVRNPDGEVLGQRVLTHPHVDEQPFTRSLTGVVIPEEATQVVIAARDSVAGFCGATVTIDVVRP